MEIVYVVEIDTAAPRLMYEPGQIWIMPQCQSTMPQSVCGPLTVVAPLSAVWATPDGPISVGVNVVEIVVGKNTILELSGRSLRRLIGGHLPYRR
jgi:hypothetical protein